MPHRVVAALDVLVRVRDRIMVSVRARARVRVRARVKRTSASGAKQPPPRMNSSGIEVYCTVRRTAAAWLAAWLAASVRAMRSRLEGCGGARLAKASSDSLERVSKSALVGGQG